ncbi:MAG: thioredoxin domain-containing protein [Gemmatimonadota bacterium]
MNRLAHETSPYLLQHAGNPVDWYPWVPEALDRARSEDKPILLSIGYAACHWCHVMEHESFENEATAALMNELFVNIKVDREERPDLDSIYMQAVQALTGHGGWPMTVFLTPDGEPFYGGTYFPPSDRHGIPGFPRVLRAVADGYRNNRQLLDRNIEGLRRIYASNANPSPTTGDDIGADSLAAAVSALKRQFDPVFGGFGGAPKFPPSMVLDFLLRAWARNEDAESLEIVRKTWLAMAHGGIYDQVAGGLHRYSVDERWLVPHFEKMLYDNALFISVGAQLWQATRDPEVRRVTLETVQWVKREMTSPEGGFYSSLDADSEGHEGKFYIWTAAEFDRVLGADAGLMRRYWGVTDGGNFEGANILHVTGDGDLAPELPMLWRAKAALLEERSHRIHPALDDKILAGWNGLMTRALALAARSLDDEEARSLTLANGRFLISTMVDRGGAVRRSFRAGRTLPFGFLEDQAAVGLALLELFTLTGDTFWLEHVRSLARSMIDLFHDPESRRFFDTARHHETLITRPRDINDNATPAGTSLAAELCLRLGVLDDDVKFLELGSQAVREASDAVARFPQAFGQLLGVADLIVHGAVEVAIVGAERQRLERALGTTYVPSLVAASVPDASAEATALTRGKVVSSGVSPPDREDGEATAFVCRKYVCDAPTRSAEVFVTQLERARVARR